MNEVDYRRFCNNQRYLAGRHLRDKLGDLCEDLGWERRTYLDLRQQEVTAKLKAGVLRMTQATQKFLEVLRIKYPPMTLVQKPHGCKSSMPSQVPSVYLPKNEISDHFYPKERIIMEAYCENGDCRVMLYRIDPVEPREGHDQNCPGCGRFGRMKDNPKAPSAGKGEGKSDVSPGLGGYGVID